MLEWLQRALPRSWRTRGPLAWALWPLSLAYLALVLARRWLYRNRLLPSASVGVPVVVVGNVVAGGAGKTPLVIALVRHLRERGMRPGVISRGHGRLPRDCREVFASDLPRDVGDEPALIRRQCAAPVFVAPRRADAANALLARYPQTDVILCDDGLQHLALRRDLEICVFDERGVGNGFLLPAGPLREPWPRRVDLVLHTGAEPAFAGHRATRVLADEVVGSDAGKVNLAALHGKPVVAVAAIARPEAFFAMLRERGIRLATTIALPDHDDFAEPLRGVSAEQPLLCTEKDAVKLWRHHPQALAVPMELRFDDGFMEAFDRLLHARLSSTHGPQTP